MFSEFFYIKRLKDVSATGRSLVQRRNNNCVCVTGYDNVQQQTSTHTN